MKTLNISLEDKEYNLLKKLKGKLSWKEFLMKDTKKKKDPEGRK